MNSRYRDIIFLLGAGASAEAGIPTSSEMSKEIEILLRDNKSWQDYDRLYNHIKSAIHYAAGLNGLFSQNVPYNIETLVNTLYELERNEKHPLYPFIASMNARLMTLAGQDFANVRDFRGRILDRLKHWMSPDDHSKGTYYTGLKRLQQDINFPLHVFSLNYDLCVERLASDDFRIETGFENFGPRFPWNWARFEEREDGPEPPQIYLYKLHGSINWKRDPRTKLLCCVEQTAGIEPESMELIFGREFKVEAADPYLFYLYAFRVALLDAKLVVLVGYGFGDTHINNLLAEAVRSDPQRRILAVSRCPGDNGDSYLQRIRETLGIKREEHDQVQVFTKGASEFFLQDRLAAALQDQIPANPAVPF